MTPVADFATGYTYKLLATMTSKHDVANALSVLGGTSKNNEA